jgi:hypothetical protein
MQQFRDQNFITPLHRTNEHFYHLEYRAIRKLQKKLTNGELDPKRCFRTNNSYKADKPTGRACETLAF